MKTKMPLRDRVLGLKREDGSMSEFSLFLFMLFCGLGGLALDMAHITAARTQLQVAADTAAHAALYLRDSKSAEESKDLALELARSQMPTESFGDIITVDDIQFGDYDPDTRTFTPDPLSRNASGVVAFRVSDRQNSLAGTLLGLFGFNNWDVVTASIFETFRPTCFREGMVGEDVVDVQSNNSYSNGFCIHSNKYVSVNSNNYYEPGTVVSMPKLSDIELPRSGYETNTGLYEALRPGKYRIRILSQLDEIVDGMTNANSRFYRSDYVDNPTPVKVNWKNNLGLADFTSRRVNVIECAGKKVNLGAGVYKEMVIIGKGCDFKLMNGVVFEDITFITTHTGDTSIDAPNGLVLGRNDNCAEGGSAQVITYGGVKVASGLQVYDSQIIAKGPILFEASTDGIKGASIISGEWIEGTSNSNLGFCGKGMGNNYEAEYFRMRA